MRAGDATLWVRGATYGTFGPGPHGGGFPEPALVERDFAAMAASGFNAVRTYTVPPRWLLDAAAAHGLRVMVGLAWEQHVAFADDRHRARSIEARLRAGVRACAEHPAVLCYAVGNEIPAPIVRWHGRRRIERFLGRLGAAAKDVDPGALVTYVNYPSTEYLETAFADLVCFNVYLESAERLDAYLARLHNLAGDRPLVLAEIGLDSRRHGEFAQARLVERQVRGAFAAGCAGAFVFAWTDEWHRGGHEVLDWDFGLTDRARRPKPALLAVQRALTEVPLPPSRPWPRVSVVVCSYNGARTIGRCLESLRRLQYSPYEVIVVDDGSTDATAAIAARAGVGRLVSTPNRGLSNARNTGLALATGEIVAYIDDDASADPHWLTYLAWTFMTTAHAAAGGPNLPPPEDGEFAHAVAAAPGGPAHVLLSDTEAEHVPGCNMAFRKSALEALGGFDPRFRTAGDDVDICWRVRDRGWTIGFVPSAMVWHHRRGSLRAYWKQQAGYGRAEALLEAKWPERYNGAGHATWAGRIYGVAASGGWRRSRVYHGTWGSALFQSLYRPAPGRLASAVTMPEWYVVVVALAALSALAVLWTPLLAALAALAAAVVAPVVLAARAAALARPPSAAARGARLRFVVRVFLLHLVHPLARLHGRLRHGLVPWRRRPSSRAAWPRPAGMAMWTEQWQAPETRLATLEAALRGAGALVRRGGPFDRWDLGVRGGPLGSARVRLLVEEHGAGRQLARLRIWPHWSGPGSALAAALAAVAAGAAVAGAWPVAALLGGVPLALAVLAAREAGAALGAVRAAWTALARATPGAVVPRGADARRAG